MSQHGLVTDINITIKLLELLVSVVSAGVMFVLVEADMTALMVWVVWCVATGANKL